MNQLDWLLSPVTFYSMASACLLISLTLFVDIKIQIAKSRKAVEESRVARESDQTQVRGLENEIERLRESMRALESVPSPTRTATAGINLTKRAQALRMHRRGEAVPSIAAALETPSNEIALLLKLQSLTSEATK